MGSHFVNFIERAIPTGDQSDSGRKSVYDCTEVLKDCIGTEYLKCPGQSVGNVNKSHRSKAPGFDYKFYYNHAGDVWKAYHVGGFMLLLILMMMTMMSKGLIVIS
jgi:hypothetical protein